MPIKLLFFLFPTFFCLLLPASGLAQCYADLLNKGNAAMKNKNYALAIQKYEAAKICPDVPPKHNLNALIAKARAAQQPVAETEKPKTQNAKTEKSKLIRKQPEEQINEQPEPTRTIPDPFAGTMVRIEGGTFTMGCQDGRDKDCKNDEKPAHSVTVSSFNICKYEVTQAQWRAVMGTNPSFFYNCDDCPVESVSYNDIQKFLKKLNAGGRSYRLPTEAEWEFAARGGNKSKGYLYSGSNDIASVAWYNSNSGSKTHTVGSKQTNELGLYDMSGNVWEWCADWKIGYPGSIGDSNASSTGCVIRSGCWQNYFQYCRITNRDHASPTGTPYLLGFRVVSSTL